MVENWIQLPLGESLEKKNKKNRAWAGMKVQRALSQGFRRVPSGPVTCFYIVCKYYLETGALGLQ